MYLRSFILMVPQKQKKIFLLLTSQITNYLLFPIEQVTVEENRSSFITLNDDDGHKIKIQKKHKLSSL